MAVLPREKYEPVGLRCVLPACEATGEVGLGFDRGDGSVLRLRISGAQAAELLASLQVDQGVPKAAHAPRSSGSPSVEGSVTPGQSQ